MWAPVVGVALKLASLRLPLQGFLTLPRPICLANALIGIGGRCTVVGLSHHGGELLFALTWLLPQAFLDETGLLHFRKFQQLVDGKFPCALIPLILFGPDVVHKVGICTFCVGGEKKVQEISGLFTMCMEGGTKLPDMLVELSNVGVDGGDVVGSAAICRLM